MILARERQSRAVITTAIAGSLLRPTHVIATFVRVIAT